MINSKCQYDFGFQILNGSQAHGFVYSVLFLSKVHNQNSSMLLTYKNEFTYHTVRWQQFHGVKDLSNLTPAT